jgi:hypothetical protein
MQAGAIKKVTKNDVSMASKVRKVIYLKTLNTEI